MSVAKKMYYAACGMLPTGLVQKIAAPATLFPYHHTVSDESLAHIKNLYDYKNIAQFTADLDYLLKHFKALSAAEVYTAVSNQQPLPKNAFLLSFDDGFREIHDIIAPILLKKGVPAIFFINPAYINNQALFYRCKISLLIGELRNANNSTVTNAYAKTLTSGDTTIPGLIHVLKHLKKDTTLLNELAAITGFSFDEYLVKQRPFMTDAELTSLHQQGFSLGGHSWSHPYYDSISREQQVKETTSSCEYIQQITGEQCNLFSFPHSDAGLPQALFDELLKHDIGLLFGIQNQKEELNNRTLQRFNAERPDVEISRLVKGMMLMTKARQLIGKNKVHRV